MRRLLFTLLLATLVGCGTPEVPEVEALEVVPQWSTGGTGGASGTGGAGSAVADYPDHLVVKVTLENPSAAVKLLGGRARISYGGRRVAMLTLEDKVKIPARQRAVVELPLRLNIQRTTQTMQLQAALKQGRTEGIEVDWQVALRSRMAYVEQSQEAMPLERLMGRSKEQIVEMLKEIFEE